jgi:hypothetical protein
MLVTTQYLFLPGVCSLCGSSHLPTIDTGIDLDWQNAPEDPNPSHNRRFYICADCAITCAQMVLDSRNLEMKPAGTVSTLEDLLTDTSQKNALLLARVQELETALTIVKEINPLQQQKITPGDIKTFEVVPKDVLK